MSQAALLAVHRIKTGVYHDVALTDAELGQKTLGTVAAAPTRIRRVISSEAAGITVREIGYQEAPTKIKCGDADGRNARATARETADYNGSYSDI